MGRLGNTGLRIVVAAQTLTTLLAAIALVLSLTSIAGRIDAVQSARERSAVDSCELIRGIVLATTPPKGRARALAFINDTELRNCEAYGRSVRLLP